jgi:hypothetical protein
MNNCIFSAHCIEQICDKSCPTYTETSYLLERNGITLNNQIFNIPNKDIEKSLSILDKADKKFKIVVTDNTSEVSNLLTYCAICFNWQGSRLHCNVYNLKFSNHVEAIQKSWNYKNSPESLEYEQIWTKTAKILIISNIDFVNFKEFQAQTLLNMIHERKDNGLTTIVVSPEVDTLIGSGSFYNRMKLLFEGSILKW